MMHSWLVLGLVVAAAAAGYDYRSQPDLYYDTWWGPEGKEEDTTIRPFRIEWDKKDIDDLVYRLKNRREFVPSLDDSAYRYGVNTHTFGFWLDYWANDYNFTAREQYLNQYPQFKTDIQGLGIHFIWIKPEVPEGKINIPVLMLHGFPGSVREFYDAIKEIQKATENKNFVLELIIPSLPGFGYSDYSNKEGLGAAEMAFIYKNLMNRLGHEKYFMQGGDWGSLITANMATFFPDEIIGYHNNMGVALTDAAFSMMSIASLNPSSIMSCDVVNRLYPLKNTFEQLTRDSGYFHVHATKPDTLGISVSDSPTALMAWLFQQVSICTRKANYDDPEGGLHRYRPEQLLDNLMFYWMPNKGPTSFRIYSNTFNLRNYHLGYLNVTTTVPTVVVQASDEIFYMPPSMLKTKFSNLLAVDVLNDYGHFLAFEVPDVFASNFVSAVQRILAFNNQNMNVRQDKQDFRANKLSNIRQLVRERINSIRHKMSNYENNENPFMY
ncbi:juvenile hormone epoxide hydrolase isoform X1 [Manduca sexta]|uniref:juvenile hormone epoxide hydrolase isoform X1 n=2 Tax=Manduca sexta TaxID=7130 RepID=UPI00188F5C98|nr:juvenile hormone epoxide hydrolase isoform X1 [Manduca sexta]